MPRTSHPADRRRFLHSALGLGSLALSACQDTPPPATADDGWRAPGLRHLIPSFSADRLRIKASWHEPRAAAPLLELRAGRERLRIEGRRSDTGGRCWSFDAAGLQAATRYELRLQGADGAALSDPWPLTTAPAADARPRSMRILAYSCAGGSELAWHPWRGRLFLPLAQRRALLQRGLSFAPDAVIANGDHVYWDVRSKPGIVMARSPQARWAAGSFERGQPVMGTANEELIHRGFAPQIADLYGTLLRSTPAFFLQDDHDYTENDEADENLRTFPPDRLMREVARATQRMYYPELPAPDDLPPAWRGDAGPGFACSFGSLRHGQLLELQLFDCRGHLRNDRDPLLKDAAGSFVPPEVEAWLLARMGESRAAHLVHMPSTPLLWSAGKWGEWYGDRSGPDGHLDRREPKPFWSPGWFEQHNRLLRASAARADATALWLGGDLHASAAGQILAIEGRPLPRAVASVLVGTLGSQGPTFASKFRGQAAEPSGSLAAEEWVRPIEENGFSLIDIAEASVSVSLFRWQPQDGVDKIAALQPFWRRRFERQA
ncbi:alkaline phosphatase D family protein [Roseateles violae]|uniref:Alkaline phosphatase D family protein n=1 Tax=Roseateles violae TaxID=3058042 RepID=A0ABT8DUE3_9BURK|nr:alkaline phosphatase D family protein [Pelomonas sp. PFR6]MDN3921681.1 alkaline phosphatase D family protein [Pelomonas sp. PFR6]